jgi:integrase
MRKFACLVKRGDVWSVKQPLPDGKYKWHRVGTRKRDAEKVRDELNRRAAMGSAYTAPPETWKQFTTAWRERYAQRVRPSTLEQAKTALGHLDQFDERLIETLTRAELEDAVAVIAKRTPRTAQIVLRIAKQVLSDAKSRGQVVDERIFDIPPPRHRERDPRFPTWADAERLAEWMPESIARIVPVALATGLREGELLRLRDADVDLRRGTLTVRESKTRSGVRTVELAGVAVQLLREQLMARTPNERGLVFPTPTGCEWDRHTFMGRVFRPAVRRAQLDGMNFHDLRHGHVSLMAAAGVHPTTIAALVGHGDGGALLMRRYRHLFPDEAGRAVAAFDRLIVGSARSAEGKKT